jgi:hypothetical protein
MSFRPIRAASLSLSLCSIAWPLQALAQTSSEPNSSVSAAPITVQIAPPPISISSAMLGISGPLGAQSASGKPMFAEFITEHRQSFIDGNHISRSTASSIYRDSEGRIRRESQLSVPGLPAGVSASTFITIVDRQLGYGYVLDPQEMVAHRYELNGPGPSYIARVSAQGNGNALLSPDPKQPAESSVTVPSPAPSSGSSHWRLHAFYPRHDRQSEGFAGNSAVSGASGIANSSSDVANGSGNDRLSSGILPQNSASMGTGTGTGIGTGAPPMRIDQPFLAAPNPVRTENLGEQVILGFHARGTRVITTLPAGQIGNDRPIDIVSEQWFSPELELVMRSMHRDPWAGEFTTTITRISRGDQPASLFAVPERYKVIDAASEGEHHVLDGHGSHSPGPAPW